jgi:hypothetical protein
MENSENQEVKEFIETKVMEPSSDKGDDEIIVIYYK